MNTILLLTVIASVALGFLRVFTKLVALSFPPLLGLASIYIFVGIAGVLIFFFLSVGGTRPTGLLSKQGLFFVALVALSFVVFDFLALLVFRIGGKAAIFTPITAAGSILVAILIGPSSLGENVTILQIVGAILAIVGITLLAL